MRRFVALSLTALALTSAALPAAATTEDFHGAYVGISLGYDEISGGYKGAAGAGVLGGYNFVINDTWIWGVEGNFDLSTAKKETFPNLESRSLYSYDAGGRFGYLLDDQTMLYLKAGYHSAKLRNETLLGTSTTTVEGYTVGGGAEFAVTDSVAARIGYDYSNAQSGYERHRVRAILGYYF